MMNIVREMMLDRPPHMYDQLPSGDTTGQPDENTGADYEQLNRKYDSEDEFEILWFCTIDLMN